MTKERTLDGIGLGLRHDLAQEMFERAPDEVRWLEIHPENYVARGGAFELNLERALEEGWPVVPHGLTLCFGTTTRFDNAYLKQVRTLLDRIDAPWYSDHLCFAGAGGLFLHDLLPLPTTRESVLNVAERVREVQDAIGRPVAIENVSYYADPSPERGRSEIDFLLEVLDTADSKLLLDVNNVYVNSINHGFDPKAYIDQIPAERVVQMHVAGHFTRKDGIIIDTHGEPVCDGVYELLEHTIERIGPKPVLLERDQNFPPLDELLEEMRLLQTIYDRASNVHFETASRNEDPARGALAPSVDREGATAPSGRAAS